MRRIRLAIRRKTVADEEERQEGRKAEGQQGAEAEGREGGWDREDGLEGNAIQERREANEHVQEGGSLPRRGAAQLKAILESVICASADPLTRKPLRKPRAAEPQEDVNAALAE